MKTHKRPIDKHFYSDLLLRSWWVDSFKEGDYISIVLPFE